MTKCTKISHVFHRGEGPTCQCGKMTLRLNDDDEYVASPIQRPRVHVHRIMSSNWDDFSAQVEDFIFSHNCHLESMKFQRNLYYSLSGSTHVKGKVALKEGKELKEDHIAFIVWED